MRAVFDRETAISVKDRLLNGEKEFYCSTFYFAVPG